MAAMIGNISVMGKWPSYLNERELGASILSECVRLQLQVLGAGDIKSLLQESGA